MTDKIFEKVKERYDAFEAGVVSMPTTTYGPYKKVEIVHWDIKTNGQVKTKMTLTQLKQLIPQLKTNQDFPAGFGSGSTTISMRFPDGRFLDINHHAPNSWYIWDEDGIQAEDISDDDVVKLVTNIYEGKHQVCLVGKHPRHNIIVG